MYIEVVCIPFRCLNSWNFGLQVLVCHLLYSLTQIWLPCTLVWVYDRVLGGQISISLNCKLREIVMFSETANRSHEWDFNEESSLEMLLFKLNVWLDYSHPCTQKIPRCPLKRNFQIPFYRRCAVHNRGLEPFLLMNRDHIIHVRFIDTRRRSQRTDITLPVYENISYYWNWEVKNWNLF